MSQPTILIVEDEPSTHSMLRVALESDGYAVVEASNGRVALAEAAREMPALILDGRVSPDVMGLAFTEHLRGLPGGSNIPILCLSSLIGSEQGHGIGRVHWLDVVRSQVRPPVTRVEGGGGRRVLVVDADPVALQLTTLHLQLLGFEVASASTALEALRWAIAQVPDAILTNVLMPELDGFQLCVELRKEPGLRRVPILLASGWFETEGDRELARRVGATALVRKTPDLGNVASFLLSAIRAERLRSSDAISVEDRLARVQAVVGKLEQQVSASAHLARRCTLQATQISLLGGAADVLASSTGAAPALAAILAATVDAAGLSKGVLYLQNERGQLALRQAIGFSNEELARLDNFFGQMAALEEAIHTRAAVVIPTTIVRRPLDESILAGAGSLAAQIVPLTSEGRGVGALILFAAGADVMSDDTIAFARAMGNQLAQSFEIATSFARLAASERRYRAVAEAANDAISVMRPDGEILDINPSFQAALGSQPPADRRPQAR